MRRHICVFRLCPRIGRTCRLAVIRSVRRNWSVPSDACRGERYIDAIHCHEREREEGRNIGFLLSRSDFPEYFLWRKEKATVDDRRDFLVSHLHKPMQNFGIVLFQMSIEIGEHQGVKLLSILTLPSNLRLCTGLERNFCSSLLAKDDFTSLA